MRNRLTGTAETYKGYLDKDLLRDPQEGVSYFKKELRKFFVKGTTHVFLWRFMQLFKAHRGQQDYHLWLGRFGVMVKRLQDSWMDCLEDMTDDQVDQLPEVIR